LKHGIIANKMKSEGWLVKEAEGYFKTVVIEEAYCQMEVKEEGYFKTVVIEEAYCETVVDEEGYFKTVVVEEGYFKTNILEEGYWDCPARCSLTGRSRIVLPGNYKCIWMIDNQSFFKPRGLVSELPEYVQDAIANGGCDLVRDCLPDLEWDGTGTFSMEKETSCDVKPVCVECP